MSFEIIYGPVPSWRLGSSLGIDPISRKEKICTFDCVYCQLGRTQVFSGERKIYVPTSQLMEEIELLPSVKIDTITFAGRGEPTLAANLGDMIREVKKIRKEKTAVITNSSLMHREDVKDDLLQADIVAAKLDAVDQAVFESVNRPFNDIKVRTVIQSIMDFKRIYKGKLALQIMMTGQNKAHAREIAQKVFEINPDEIQINTPLRPCGVPPLAEQEIEKIKGYFAGLNVISVYEAEKKKVKAISGKETLRRRGKI